MRSPRPASAREWRATGFTPLLERLITRIPGAFAAALVDNEGECVDYVGSATAFDVQVAAAEWLIVLSRIAFTSFPCLKVRAARASYIARALPDGYAVVLVLSRRAGFSPTECPLDAFEYDASIEAGWRPRSHRWRAVSVHCAEDGVPSCVQFPGGDELPITAAPANSPKSPRQMRFRARTATGLRMTLVRDATGEWYGKHDDAGDASSAG